MYVDHMTGGLTESTVKNPSWPQVRDAILAMNQGEKYANQIHLASSSRDQEGSSGPFAPFMMIGGGRDIETETSHYVCEVTHVDAIDGSGHASAFREYFLEREIEEDKDFEEIGIVIGDNWESMDEEYVVDSDLVLAAAKYFFEHGEMNPDLEWCLYGQSS